jgi:hypothetical protein
LEEEVADEEQSAEQPGLGGADVQLVGQPAGGAD